MNYIDKIKNAMRPKLHEVEVGGVTFWIHRPSLGEAEKCGTIETSLVLLVKDENGDPVFAHEDIEGRVNVNNVDVTLAIELYTALAKVSSNTDEIENIEKK
ncbi:TPA: hypothetical protein JG946_003760 [Enterobacter hormaechei subsp. steigerwaltii]|nr:hypothetical protein [Enterobacter hormaechei subsp. steigerwaltii]